MINITKVLNKSVHTKSVSTKSPPPKQKTTRQPHPTPPQLALLAQSDPPSKSNNFCLKRRALAKTPGNRIPRLPN